MAFHYGSGDVIPDLDARSPVRNAMHTAASSFTTMLSFVLMTVAIVLPWLVLAALGWWIVINLRRRFGPSLRLTTTQRASEPDGQA